MSERVGIPMSLPKYLYICIYCMFIFYFNIGFSCCSIVLRIVGKGFGFIYGAHFKKNFFASRNSCIELFGRCPCAFISTFRYMYTDLIFI